MLRYGVVEGVMRKKKSGFWTFIFSFIPGCAEMYAGLMKQGVSLLAVFMTICFVSAVTRIDALMFVGVVIWFYSFFHARNVAHMDDQQLNAVEDNYMFKLSEINLSDKRRNKIIAAVLIVIGAWMIFNTLWDMLREIIPENIYWMIDDAIGVIPGILVGALIIWIGVRLIKGKKQELLGDKNEQ